MRHPAQGATGGWNSKGLWVPLWCYLQSASKHADQQKFSGLLFQLQWWGSRGLGPPLLWVQGEAWGCPVSLVDTKPVQRLFSPYWDGPMPSQDELGKALDTMEGMVALATPVFLHGEFHGERSLVGYSPWGCKELDTTELLTFIFRGKKA